MRTSTGARPPCEGADRRPGWSTARAGYHDPPSRADKNGLRRARHSVRTQGQRRRVGQGDSTCDRPSQTLSTMAMSHSTPAGLRGGNRVNRGGSRHDREGIDTRGAASRDMPCAQPCTVTRRAGPKAVPCRRPRTRAGMTSGPRGACLQVCCGHIPRVGTGGADVLTKCSQKGLGRQVDVGKRAQQTTTFLRARARATDGYGVRKWSIDGMRKKLACAASHGRAFEGWDGPDGRRRGAPMTLRVPRFF